MGETANWGWVIFIILILFFFTGGNGFLGRGTVAAAEISNCEVQKQNIIDTARTQYLIEERNREVENSINANINTKYAADQAEKLFDAKMALLAKDQTIERMTLANTVNMQFTALNSKIDSLACETPKRPPYYALGCYPCNGTGTVV